MARAIPWGFLPRCCPSSRAGPLPVLEKAAENSKVGHNSDPVGLDHTYVDNDGRVLRLSESYVLLRIDGGYVGFFTGSLVFYLGAL